MEPAVTVVYQEDLAGEAANVIARLLRGERAEDIPIEEGLLTPTVNWQPLQRWRIPLSRLPVGAVIANRESSIWEEHKWFIVAVSSLCMVESLLIVGLLISRKRRQCAEQSLIESRRLLQTAHDAQRRLTALLLRAQDDERRRIARDLHDVTVQNLVAIKTVLRRVQKASQNLDDRTLEKLIESLAVTDQVIQELRTLCYVLHPPLLDELGLIPALQWFIRGFSERSEIDVELSVRGNVGRLATDPEIALFRVVQESLSNVDRHSGSTRALVSFEQDESSVVLKISDHSRAVSERTHPTRNLAEATPGVGILGMKERLSQLGGELEIQSGDQGMTVTARIPIQKAKVCYVS